MPRIFISYAKKDTYALAVQIRDALHTLPGVTAWMDEFLEEGESWAAQIQSEIRQCDLMIVLLSPDVNRDPKSEKGISFVINEIDYAQRLRKPIIPIMAQPTDPPVQIASVQFVDFTRDPAAGMQKLLKRVSARFGVEAPSPSPTPEPIVISKTVTVPAQPSALRRYVIIGAGTLLLVIVAVELIISLWNNPPPATETFVPTTAPTQAVIKPTDAPTQTPAPPTDTATLNPQAAAQATHDANLTRAAESWTPLPTVDVQASIHAAGTALANQDLTATATLWTPTNTPTSTLTSTPTPLPGYPGGAPITSNNQWTEVHQTINGVEMVLVPYGCFDMGNDASAYETLTQGVLPGGNQCIQPFWIDLKEVTNEQFERFKGVADNLSGWSDPNRPRERITWIEARDFCELRGARLPKEAEWEYAARGPDALRYPWGNDFNPDNVVYKNNSNSQTADVGSRLDGASWVGALDMSGNVWEWVLNIYRKYPYNASNESEADNDRTDVPHVLRGGSWYFDKYIVRAAGRNGVNPQNFTNDYGVRCALTYLLPEQTQNENSVQKGS